MTDQQIASNIIQALADYLKRDAASITEDLHLRDDLGLDSMAVIELLYKIEETFNIQIPDQDLMGLRTVGSVAAYVQTRVMPEKKTPSSTRKASPKPASSTSKKSAVAAKSKAKKKTR
jgi:acyl carrier protein